jgi:hypothetical protein
VTVVRFDGFSEATDVPRERVFREIWKVVFKRRVVWLPLCLCCVTTKRKKHKKVELFIFSTVRQGVTYREIKVIWLLQQHLPLVCLQ